MSPFYKDFKDVYDGISFIKDGLNSYIKGRDDYNVENLYYNSGDIIDEVKLLNIYLYF